MPKKTPEEIREQVVSLRKGGASYTQIQRQVVSPETGQPLTRPTVIKILREAGLTKGARAAAPPTSQEQSGRTPSSGPSKLAPSSSNGVDDFMPPKVQKPVVVNRVQCDQCGTTFQYEDGDDLPEICPECGG